MIIKNLTRKNNSGQLIKYILRYILTEEKQMPKNQKAPKPFLIRHNIRSRSVDGYIREFQSNNLTRIHKRSNQIALHHTILSWSDKDAIHITEEMLSDIAKQYIRLRGENNLFLGTVHRDRSHIHIHLAVSGTELNGKASRISKEKFADIKKSLTLYQKEKYPSLCHSLPRHGKKKESECSKNLTRPFSTNTRLSKKEQLATHLEKIKSDAKSFNEFLSLLKVQSYEPYYRGTEKILTGIKLEGVKYRFKTLGFDTQVLDDYYLTVAKEEKEMREIGQLRKRAKDRELSKENTRSRDKISTGQIKYSPAEIPMINVKEGDGEASPYKLFNQEELSFTR
jgi:hypothetical protein